MGEIKFMFLDLLKYFFKLWLPKCEKCGVGKIHHSHTENIGTCTISIEVYECDFCKEKFV